MVTGMTKYKFPITRTGIHFQLTLKHKVDNNNIHTLIELICCFGLTKLKNVSTVTIMSIAVTMKIQIL